jgi:hypothetical protein
VVFPQLAGAERSDVLEGDVLVGIGRLPADLAEKLGEEPVHELVVVVTGVREKKTGFPGAADGAPLAAR